MSALELEDAKEDLNITDSDSDVELQDTIDAAEAAIARHVGPLVPTVRTARCSTRGGTLSLPDSPVVSLTSVTALYGLPLDVAQLLLDSEDGTVASTTGLRILPGEYDVVYTAGWATVPADLLYAIKVMTKHLWNRQQRNSNRRGQAPADQVTTPGYLLPNMVAELIEPFIESGFA